MMLRFFCVPAVLLLFGAPIVLLSQSLNDFGLDTVAIATSRVEQSAWQSGRYISVLTARDLAQLPIQSVDEALRYVTGVEIQSRNGFGAQADVLIRGTNFNQVLVLLDGMRINDPLTGHFNLYLPISLAELSRIEVLRGPAAALYGPDAVGGVIHLVSKTFDENYRATDWEGQAELNLGEYYLLTAGAGAYVPGKRLTFSAGGNWNRSEGQPLPPDSTDIRNDFNIQTASASLAYQLNDEWRVALRGSYDLRTFNAQYFYTRSAFDLSREQTEQWWTQARLSHLGEQSKTTLDIAYKVMEDSFLFNPAFSANIHQTQFFNAQFHHQQYLQENIQLGLGFQGDRRSITSNDRGNHETVHGGAYLMGLWTPTPAWSLNLSVRADADENYGLEWLPQANLAYQQGNLTLRASSGRSIRAADFTERFISNNLPGPLSSGRNLGNPDLLAERSWSHEAGLDLRFPSGLQLTGTAFLRQGRNLIDYFLTPTEEILNVNNLAEGGEYFYTQNFEMLDVYGAETNLSYRASLGPGRLRTELGYQHLNTIQATNERSKYLASFARHLLSWRAVWEQDRIQVGLQGLMKVRDAEAAAAINSNLESQYAVWNARVSVKPALQLPLRINLQVTNLLNAQYQDILGAKMPDRWFLLGLSWSNWQ